MRDRGSPPTLLLVRSSAIIFAYRSSPLSSHPGGVAHRTIRPVCIDLEPTFVSEEPHVYCSAEPVRLYMIKFILRGNVKYEKAGQ